MIHDGTLQVFQLSQHWCGVDVVRRVVIECLMGEAELA